MKTAYTVTWKSRVNAKWKGESEFVLTEGDRKCYGSLEEWAEASLMKYVADCEAGVIPANDTPLSYYIYHGVIGTNTIQMLSVFKTITDRSEIDGDMNDATKEKIQKLLNLSMSSNEHEAKLAMEKAYRLMQKHSLKREDLDQQEFLMFKMSPKGKRIASWEIILYSVICEVGGVFFSYNRGNKGDDHTPPILPVFLLGRKNDVLNASYLIECYKREVERAVKETKKSRRMGTKEANDYRQGLIAGISMKLLDEKERFFTNEAKQGSKIVPVDVRIDEAKRLFLSVKSDNVRTPKVSRSAFKAGLEDSKKITIRNAAEDKRTATMQLPNA